MICKNCYSPMDFTGEMARNTTSPNGIKVGFPLYRCINSHCKTEDLDLNSPKLLYDRPITITIFQAKEVTV